MPMKIETKTYVYSTFHICWGAQVELYYHDGIHKFMVPHSRHTTIRREEV